MKRAIRKFNAYGWYTAEFCRSTGLPMYDKRNYQEHAATLLSKSRCKAIKQPVREGEEPVAFYRVARGYCGLYERDLRLAEGA